MRKDEHVNELEARAYGRKECLSKRWHRIRFPLVIGLKGPGNIGACEKFRVNGSEQSLTLKPKTVNFVMTSVEK